MHFARGLIGIYCTWHIDDDDYAYPIPYGGQFIVMPSTTLLHASDKRGPYIIYSY